MELHSSRLAGGLTISSVYYTSPYSLTLHHILTDNRNMREPPGGANNYHMHHIELLLDSFHRFTGRSLVAPPDATRSLADVAAEVFHAPFMLASHDTQPDPVFNFGNRCALELFELEWHDFTKLPSRMSAEPMNREERARLLESVSRQNYIDDYAGVRISSTGRRFYIPSATVWNVVDRHGNYCGQAATFSQWRYLET